MTRRLPSRVKLVVVSIFGCVMLFGLYASFRLPPPAIKDFMVFFVGAKLVGTPDLYNEPAGWKVQDEIVGKHTEIIPFVRLPFWAFLLKPILLLPYATAYWIWCLLIAFSLIGFILLFPADKLVSLAVICWSMPVATAFYMGQDTTLLLPLIAGSIRLHQAKKVFAAGLVLSLCVIKFHFLIFLPVLMLLQRRWKFAEGFAAGLTALLGLSFLVQGRSWPADYLNMLVHGHSTMGPEFMYNVRGAFLSFPQSSEIHLAGSVIVALLIAVICWRTQFELALCCCLLGALLVSPHVYNQDYVLVLPLCILLLTRAPVFPYALVLGTLAPYIVVSVLLSIAMLLTIAMYPPRLDSVRMRLSSFRLAENTT